MFNETKIKKASKLLNLNEENTKSFIFKQASFLNSNAKNVLNSLIILEQLQEQEKVKKAEELKRKSLYRTKNIVIAKYMDSIIDLYTNKNFGTQRIVKHLKEHHRATISKSALENFLKTNKVQRNG